MRRLAHWWNGSHGTATRRDIWVELLPDDRYLVRWRGGEWSDRDGRYLTHSRKVAWNAVRSLLEDGGPHGWRRLD